VTSGPGCASCSPAPFVIGSRRNSSASIRATRSSCPTSARLSGRREPGGRWLRCEPGTHPGLPSGPAVLRTPQRQVLPLTGVRPGPGRPEASLTYAGVRPNAAAVSTARRNELETRRSSSPSALADPAARACTRPTAVSGPSSRTCSCCPCRTTRTRRGGDSTPARHPNRGQTRHRPRRSGLREPTSRWDRGCERPPTGTRPDPRNRRCSHPIHATSAPPPPWRRTPRRPRRPDPPRQVKRRCAQA
jgi:hypothetical protein